MPLLDLSAVTTTLMDLLRAYIPARIDPAFAFNVTAQPPESARGTTPSLSLHLYHVVEDPQMRNLPGRGSEIPNIHTAPLALDLYYILTAHHSSSNDAQDPLTQQKLFGYALTTFHDVPVITDATDIGGAIMPPSLRGGDNQLQISMRQVTPADALSFWSAEELRTARLAAYYEVRAVLFEPQPAQRIASPVLSVGTYLTDLAAPHLERTRSRIPITLPAHAGGGEVLIDAAPARVAAAPAPTPARQLELVGRSLAGIRQSLTLVSDVWRRAGLDRDRVDVGADPSWHVSFTADRVVVELQPTIDQSGTAVPILPGIYAAQVRVVSRDVATATGPRELGATSNQALFAVGPRVAGHGTPDLVTNRVTITLVAGLDLTLPALLERLEVVVDGEAYPQRFAIADLGPEGGFVVVGATSLVVQPTFSLVDPGAHAFRLLANGIESQPFWIEV